MGNGIRDGSVGTLHVADVAHEIRIEGGHIEIQHGLFRRDLRIAHPALTLVALVAVGGNAEQIGELRPADQFLNLIQDLFGGHKAAGRRHRRVHDAPAQRVKTGSAWIPRHFDIAEAVIGEPGLISFHPFTAEDINVARLGFADVLSIDHSVLVGQLAEAHLDRGAAGTADAKLDPAARVLPHVVDVDARLRIHQPYRHHRIHHLDGRHHLGRKYPWRARRLLSGLPG